MFIYCEEFFCVLLTKKNSPFSIFSLPSPQKKLESLNKLTRSGEAMRRESFVKTHIRDDFDDVEAEEQPPLDGKKERETSGARRRRAKEASSSRFFFRTETRRRRRRRRREEDIIIIGITLGFFPWLPERETHGRRRV